MNHDEFVGKIRSTINAKPKEIKKISAQMSSKKIVIQSASIRVKEQEIKSIEGMIERTESFIHTYLNLIWDISNGFEELDNNHVLNDNQKEVLKKQMEDELTALTLAVEKKEEEYDDLIIRLENEKTYLRLLIERFQGEQH